MSTLSDLLNSATPLDYSNRQLAEQAAKHGHKITHSTIAQYRRGIHPETPRTETLQALADAFKLPLSQLEEAAGVPQTDLPFNLPAKANALNQSERKAILQLIDVMVEAKTPATAKPWQKNLPTPDDMAYHLGAPTPDGWTFQPDQYDDHALLWKTYGKDWEQHYYTLAANRRKPGDDIEEPYTD